MNYTKIYESIIERSKNREIKGYTEKHHIIPKCIGGSNDKSNITKLTAREHYIAHQLLVKIYPNEYGLINAANMMCNFSEYNDNRSKNRLYGWLREKLSKEMSRIQSGKGNSQYGTRFIYNLDLKKSIRIKKEEPLPEGWLEGRKIKFDKPLKVCPECNKEFDKNRKFCSSECRTIAQSKVKRKNIFTGREDELKNNYNENGNNIHSAITEMGINAIQHRRTAQRILELPVDNRRGLV